MKHLFALFITLTLMRLSGFSQNEVPKEVLAELNASEYVIVDTLDNILFTAKSTKNGKWGLFSLYSDERQIAPMHFDSIKVFSNYNTSTTNQYFFYYDGKIAYQNAFLLRTEDGFKEKKLKYEFDEIITKTNDVLLNGEIQTIDLLYVRKGNGWGLNFMWFPFNIIPAEYSNPDDIPIVFVDDYIISEMEKIREELKSDYVIPLLGEYTDTTNGYLNVCSYVGSYYCFRNPKTRLWGVYNRDGETKLALPSEYEEVEFFYLKGEYSMVLAKKQGKWGMVGIHTGEVMHDFIYKTKQEVPRTYISPEEKKLMQYFKEKHGFDRVEFDKGNGDGVFRARVGATGNWGLYQSFEGSELKQLIPPNYDSIDFFGWNGMFTGVWNNGKVGIYISPWSFEEGKQTVECLYNGYKAYNVEKNVRESYGTFPRELIYLAVKKNGLWAWIDWMTGELKTEFIYDLTTEKMPYPGFYQEY